MKELSKKELIGWLEQIKFWYTREIKTEEDEQVYQQIRRILEEKPKVTRKWLNKQVDFLIKGANKYEWQEFYSHIENMLAEAGVEVEE